jgi:uncharacterized protein (TIGR03000 family)
MYSVVLMAALTTGVDLPDLGRRGGCHGCRGGCHGGGYGGCYGGYGMGYGGCHGGYGMGYGGCSGMGYGGCYGGYGMGYGGCSGMGYGGCYGGYGMGYGGCYGGYGMGYGGCTGMGYGGCYGGMGYGGGTILQGGTTTQPAGERAPAPKQKREESLLPAPATIVVDLPADAKLLIDNEATTSTGRSRVFQSPTLNPGKEYQYTLTAQIVRDGKSVKAEQVVTVKAGQTTPVTLTLPIPGVAQR